jgi:hypothetical protein
MIKEKMRRKFGETLHISTPYRPETGSFAKHKTFNGEKYKVLQWHYCRDIFHPQLYNLDLFFFSHDSNRGHCVTAFMKKIEKKLDVDIPSEFGPTQKNSIMWIRPSRWWTIRSMRRSLFTILLRSANNFSPSKNNFKEALLSDPYAMATSYAINRFLKGFTFYTGKKKGWLDQFYETKIDKKTIDSLLVEPI